VIVVELENIGGLAGRHRFEFREGLSEVIAPNATGKTSLIKALLAIYAPNALPPSQLLNIDANEGYIRLVVDGREFVRRFKRVNGRVVEVESRPFASDDKVRYLVLDPYMGEIARRLIAESNPDVTDYIIRTFRLDEYEQRIKTLREEIGRLQSEERLLIETVEELRKAEEEKRRYQEQKERLREELEKLKEVSIERVKSIQERMAALSRRLGEISRRIEDLEKPGGIIETTAKTVEDLRADLERYESIVKEFYATHRDPEGELKRIKAEIDDIEEFIRKLQEEFREYLAGLDARIPVVRLAKTTKALVCPVCGRPIENPEEFWSRCEAGVEDEVRRIKESIVKDYEAKIARANEQLRELWKELEDLQKKYNEVRDIVNNRIPTLRRKLEELEMAREYYVSEVARLKNERDVIKRELEDLRRQLTEEERVAAERRAELERRLGEVEQSLRNLEEVIARKSEAGVKLAEVRRRVEELSRELERTEAELHETMNRLVDEFARVAVEVARELGFTWIKSVRLNVREVRDPRTGRLTKAYEIRVVRRFPSGREYEQPVELLSTSERATLALVTVIVGYRLKIIEEYGGLAPILADEALLAFDPERLEKVVEELRKHSKYVIVTRLVEPRRVEKLTVVHRG